MENFEKKITYHSALWQTPKTGNTSCVAARIGAEQSKTPPLLHERAALIQAEVGSPRQHASRALTTGSSAHSLTKSGSISSKPLLDTNRRSQSATSIQSQTKARLLAHAAKSGKSSDDLLKNGSFSPQQKRVNYKTTTTSEVKVQSPSQKRPLNFTSRGWYLYLLSYY